MKYMGSKNRIAKYIVPIIQSYIGDNGITQYVEPFVGGANVIDKIRCEERYGYDKDKYLIALLKRVQEHGTLLDEVPRELYDEAKATYKGENGSDNFEDWEIGNIGFLASFNGKGFNGGYAKPGYERTKRGLRYRDYYQESKNNILAQAESLVGIKFEASDYRDCPEYTNALIYCDPPYANTTGYSSSKDFDHDEFWDIVRRWSKNNIVLVSEENAPNDFECIWSKGGGVT